MTAARVGASSAEKGSSRKMTSGSSANARARLVRCASPPDRFRADRLRELRDAEALEPGATRRSALAPPDAAKR